MKNLSIGGLKPKILNLNNSFKITKSSQSELKSLKSKNWDSLKKFKHKYFNL